MEQGWYLLSSRPPSGLHRAPAHPHRALPHFRAVTTSTSHAVASAPSPWSCIPMGAKSQRSRAAPHRAINQPRGCCLCHGAGTTGASRLTHFPCPSSAAVSREVDLNLELRCGRSHCWCRACRTGALAQGWECHWRAAGAVWVPHGLAVQGDAGVLAVWPWPRGDEDPLCQTYLGDGRSPSCCRGYVTEQGSAIPHWLIVLGSQWVPAAALPALQSFLSSCHVPLFDSFHLLSSSPAQ